MWSLLNTSINNSFSKQGQYVPVPFDNTDLNENKELVINHLRSADLVIPEALFDADGILQDQSGIFQIIDKNTCRYTFSGDLEPGKYLFILKVLYL
ncbi:MAG: hypothetical protein JW723_12285 [Bacteroidales bacterium]|nr:hypothetical protein [Bacteroidales bacterium]